MQIDPFYSGENYRQFEFFKIIQQTDVTRKHPRYKLESRIVESDMHEDPSTPKDKRPTVRKFYHRLKIFFDDERKKPAFTVDLKKYQLDSALEGVDSGLVNDGHVVSQISIDLPPEASAKFKKQKPKSVLAVFDGQAGRIVTVAEAETESVMR